MFSWIQDAREAPVAPWKNGAFSAAKGFWVAQSFSAAIGAKDKRWLRPPRYLQSLRQIPRHIRVFGIETEYGITVDGVEGLDVVRESIEIALVASVRRALRWKPAVADACFGSFAAAGAVPPTRRISCSMPGGDASSSTA